MAPSPSEHPGRTLQVTSLGVFMLLSLSAGALVIGVTIARSAVEHMPPLLTLARF